MADTKMVDLRREAAVAMPCIALADARRLALNHFIRTRLWPDGELDGCRSSLEHQSLLFTSQAKRRRVRNSCQREQCRSAIAAVDESRAVCDSASASP